MIPVQSNCLCAIYENNQDNISFIASMVRLVQITVSENIIRLCTTRADDWFDLALCNIIAMGQHIQYNLPCMDFGLRRGPRLTLAGRNSRPLGGNQ